MTFFIIFEIVMITVFRKYFGGHKRFKIIQKIKNFKNKFGRLLLIDQSVFDDT